MAGAKQGSAQVEPRVIDDRPARQPLVDSAALALGLAADPRIAEALLTNGQPAYVAD